MMMIEISSVNEYGEVFWTETVVAESAGAAFDHKAPNPREGAVWMVKVVADDVKVVLPE